MSSTKGMPSGGDRKRRGRHFAAVRIVAALPAWGLAMLLTAASGCAPTGQQPKGLTRLFNGKDLTGWEVLSEGFFDAAGKVHVENGQIFLGAGDAMTGIRYKGEFPSDDFEVKLDGMRVDGGDFFCGMTFPVAGGYATLILGGWGGTVVGLSNVDGLAADENETTTCIDFANKRWYRIHLLVTEGHVDVWIDNEKVIELKTAGRKFAVWPQQEDARPFGITTWHTAGALKNITLRRLHPRK